MTPTRPGVLTDRERLLAAHADVAELRAQAMRWLRADDPDVRAAATVRSNTLAEVLTILDGRIRR